jgi:hypothetical protein
MRQFVWALPYHPPRWDVAPLTPEGIMERVLSDRPAGLVPSGTDVVTVAVDLGKYLAHWMAIAWLFDGTGHIVQYGVFEIPTDSLGVERAIVAGLKTFRAEICDTGFLQPDGTQRPPELVGYDIGYQAPHVKEFLRGQDRDRNIAMIGRGSNQRQRQIYREPKKKSATIVLIGAGWHLVHQPDEGLCVLETDADQWKTWGHARFSVPVIRRRGKPVTIEPGAMTLHQAMPREHLKLSKHLTAERQVEVFEPGKGTVLHWEVVSRNNHWLDTYYMACVLGNYLGCDLVKTPEPEAAPEQTIVEHLIETDDGRPYFVTDRSET